MEREGERERRATCCFVAQRSAVLVVLYLVNDTVSLWCCRGTPSTITSVAFLRIFWKFFFLFILGRVLLDGWDRRGPGLGLGRRVLLLVSYNGRCIKHSRRLCWGLDAYHIHRKSEELYKMMGIWGQATDKRTPPLCLIPSVIHFKKIQIFRTKEMATRKTRQEGKIVSMENKFPSPQLFQFGSLCFSRSGSSHRHSWEEMLFEESTRWAT